MLTPEEANKLYEDGIRSGIASVEEICLSAMQNTVDQCGSIGSTLTEEQAEVFGSTVASEIDINGIAESVLRWFAMHGLR